MRIEDLDLKSVTGKLRLEFMNDPPMGYLRGRTLLRNHLAQSYGCSALEAEELVDTLESRGFLHFNGDPSERSEAESTWSIRPEQRARNGWG